MKPIVVTFVKISFYIYHIIPPSFEHQRAIGERESNFSEPYSQCAGDDVRPGIQHEGLETKTHYRFAFNLCVNILFLQLAGNFNNQSLQAIYKLLSCWDKIQKFPLTINFIVVACEI